VLGVDDRLPPRHIEAVGRRVERGGPALPERLVGAHFVEGMPKGVEAALLGAEGARRRPRGLGLEIAMHPFVAAILLGRGGLDELGADAELEPPDAKLREAPEGARGEWLAIVRADARGEAVRAKQAAEDQLRRLQERAVEALAGQE
jgi:hypothetical protein